MGLRRSIAAGNFTLLFAGDLLTVATVFVFTLGVYGPKPHCLYGEADARSVVLTVKNVGPPFRHHGATRPGAYVQGACLVLRHANGKEDGLELQASQGKGQRSPTRSKAMDVSIELGCTEGRNRGRAA